MQQRVIVMVLDSFGIGALPDAINFGDNGSDTLGHIDEYCHTHGLSFKIPNLLKLGLGAAYTQVNGKKLACDTADYTINGIYGASLEVSSGKDTTSGHWEIGGCPVTFDWGYFTSYTNSFPPELLKKIVKRAGIPGYLGNCHASGTTIIADLGEEHIATGKPIFYTSADSVFQIACHEEQFGLDQLYRLCEIAREELEPYNIARVIARPFNGSNKTNFARTKNRKDYSVLPSAPTILDICKEHGGEVVAIGKIGDIYAHQGTTVELKASGLAELTDTTIQAINTYTTKPTFIMTNLVDFDMNFGHRRDTVGYKEALEYFDSRIPDVLASLAPTDLLIFTADHGCDPTWAGSDHTREHIPVIGYYKGQAINIGIRSTFADIGQTTAKHLHLPELNFGKAFI
jgi:phosphopentomutase